MSIRPPVAGAGGAYVPLTRTVAGKALSTDVTLAKGDVGLSNVDNTADTAKPVSTAQATADTAVQTAAAADVTSRAALKANNLSDLGSAATARTNLGLGGAATLNVGTASGTVAAGNDSRLLAPTQPGPTYGLTAVSYRKMRRGFSRVRAGTANMVLFCVGDSVTEGNKATTFGQNYPSILAGLLNNYYVPAAQTWMFPHNDGASSAGALDPRVTVGGAWAASGATFWQNVGGAASTLSFSPSSGSCNGPASTDTFDIYYFSNSGTFTVNINGGATLATSVANAGTVNKITVTGTASASNVLNIVSSGSGNAFVLAVNAYLSTLKQVQVANHGVGASTAASWLQNSSTVYEYQNYYTQFAPDLTIISLGINDAGASATTATFQSNLASVVTRAQTPGDVLLWTFPPSSGTPYSTFQPDYVATAYPAVQASNSVAFVDVYSRFGSYSAANTDGYYVDSLHPSTFGYSDIAQAIFNALKTI